MKTINYTGKSKLIKRIVAILNEKAPLPLDGNGDPDWGTSGQVLSTDGSGATVWVNQSGGGGGDVTDVEVNGVSVVDAQGVASVTVPTATSDLNNDSGFIDSTDLSTALADYTPTANLATVATSGDYDDLLNKPSIPAAQVQSDWTQADNTQVDYIKNKPTIPTALSDLTDDSTHRVVTDTQISTWNGKSDFSGSYNDLTDKPTIPTVNDGTLTIQQNGTTLGTFTANQSGNTTVNLTGGGSGGHVIEDQNGTDMTQRANLQFADAHLTDDSVNDRTEVEVIEEVTAQGWEDATEDGLYSVDGGSAFVPITGAEIGYDANTSINQKIDAVDAKTANVAYKNVNNNFSNHQQINLKNGTTTTIGDSWLILGNNVQSGVAGNSQGSLLLYGKNSANAVLRATNMTASRTHELPDKSGTIALTDDIVVEQRNLSITFSNNYNATLTNADVSKTGYTAIGVVGFSSSDPANKVVSACYIINGKLNAVMATNNVASVSQTVTLVAFILYKAN